MSKLNSGKPANTTGTSDDTRRDDSHNLRLDSQAAQGRDQYDTHGVAAPDIGRTGGQSGQADTDGLRNPDGSLRIFDATGVLRDGRGNQLNRNDQQGATPLVFDIALFEVRVVIIDGEPWFVAKDVAEALEYTWSGNRVTHVPAEWRGVTSVVTPSGVQQMVVLSEHGLYFFLNRSDKPRAIPFQKKVAGEILPAIRKTGRYVAPTAPAKEAPEALTASDMLNIKRMVWILSHGFRFEGVWANGIWFYLRKVLALPSPQPYAVEHLPRIAHELHTLAAASDKVQTLLIAIEQEAARRIFRKGECADLVVADMQRTAFAQLDAMQNQLAALPAYLQKDVAAITDRTQATYDHHSVTEQPGYFDQGATA